MSSPFLNSVTKMMRLKHYAKRTVETYRYGIIAFINYHHQQHPINTHNSEVTQFLSYLANQRNVSLKMLALTLNALVIYIKKR